MRKAASWLMTGLVFALAAAACSGAGNAETVAVLFVGHGEPATVADGDIAVTFPDGSGFGPFGVSLGVPEEYQSSEWAAAYEEIATAMTYIFEDVNGNGIGHEMMISPEGDVPPFFTWDAYRETLDEIYTSFGGGSPHNESLAQHIANLDLGLDGAEVETYLAFLDAVPRIPDAMWEITREHDYDKMVVVPMLLSSSTHTQEVEEQIEAVLELTGDMEMVVAEPFYEVPYMRSMIAEAVMAMADHVRGNVPPDVADDDIGLLLVAHGTPYVPPYPAFGYEEGDIYSNLSLTESGFHEEIEEVSPWAIRTGRMNYAAPSIDESLAAFEADGKSHVLVIPAAFPTAAMHTMWDVAEPAVGRAALPEEGIIVHTRESGMTVYYSAQGYADLEQGGEAFRSGLAFIANSGVLELLHGDADAAP